MWHMPILLLRASKGAVVVFARELVEGFWNWGEQAILPSVYT